MVSEAHCMSFSCTELLLFNYAKVKTVFLFYGTFNMACSIAVRQLKSAGQCQNV